MATSILDAHRLREILHYDPQTGAFRWRVMLSRPCRSSQSRGWMVSRRLKLGTTCQHNQQQPTSISPFFMVAQYRVSRFLSAT